MKMKFYDIDGNMAGEVYGLTKSQVDVIYRGISTVVAAERKKSGKSYEPSSCFNMNFPTVWDEETGERIKGY